MDERIVYLEGFPMFLLSRGLPLGPCGNARPISHNRIRTRWAELFTAAWICFFPPLIPYAAGGEAKPESSPKVGELGSRQALVFEGNQTFSAETIRSSLYGTMEFLLASHPAAPLAEYPTAIENMVRKAYWRQGFPDVKIAVTVDRERQSVRVRIDEGTRYRTGEIRFTGAAKAIHEPAVQARLRAALSGDSPTTAKKGKATPLTTAWKPNDWAPFDEAAAAEIRNSLWTTLADLNFYKPTVNVSVLPVRASGKGDLVLEMVDEGLKGTIDDFGFFYPGNQKKNTDAQLLDYLGLHAGMPLQANLATTVTNQLWRSGRFLKNEARLVSLPGEGHFRLEMDLEDLEEAPPILRPLSPNALLMLKLCDWLNEFPEHPEDLVLTIRGENGRESILNSELVVSKFGLAGCVRNGSQKPTSRLAYALVASSHTFSCYSGWRERKLIAPGAGNVTAFVSVVPNSSAESNRFNLTIGAGLNSEKTERPIDLRFQFCPAKFLESALADSSSFSSKGGELIYYATNAGHGPVQVRIEKSSGRPISCRFEVRTNSLHLAFEARSEKGAYHRLVSEIAKASSKLPNSYRPAYPTSSVLGFMLTDILQSGVLGSFVVSNSVANASSPEHAAGWVATAGELKQAIALLEKALGKEDLADCLKPFEERLNRLKSAVPAAGKPADSEFFIPIDWSANQSSLQALIKWIAAHVIEKTDTLWPRNGWLWTLVRETAFSVAGENPYTGPETQRLLESKEMGPLGCWTAASLLERVNPPLAETFARRGRDSLTLEGVETDLGSVLASGNVTGELAAEALTELGSLPEIDLKAFYPLLGANLGQFLIETAGSARSSAKQEPIEVLRPALTHSWESQLRPTISAALQGLLERMSHPSTPEAAYQRANFILQTATTTQDFEQAAGSLEFAASNGMAVAQLRLGNLYKDGQGVPRDYAEALNWWMKAAEQNEPHAACRIGDFYFEGLGAPSDPGKASVWYEREARRGCSNAQFRMGLCADQSSNPVAALAWYRLAATNGVAAAEMTLAERMSDEFLAHPDYAEAYLWYRAAAEAGNRVAAVSARRLTAKLSSSQLEELDKEACRIAKRTDNRPAQ